MATLRDPRYERVAQLLALGKSTEEASREAGYKDGTSFAANARKRSQRPEIRARVAELLAKEADLVAIDAAWIRRKTAKIAGVEFGDEEVRPGDALAALSLLAKMTEGALVPQKIAPTKADGTDLTDEGAVRELVTAVIEMASRLEAMADNEEDDGPESGG